MTLSGTLIAANGGTGQSSYTVGDILYASSTTALTKLGVGSNGQVLKVASGLPSWAADTNTGLTSVGITETGTALTITGSPLTSNGTINIAGAGSANQVILGNLSLATLPVDGVTSIGIAPGTGLDVTNSPITSSGNIGITLDLNELTTVTSINATSDFLVGVGSAPTNEKILYSNVHLHQWGAAEANVDFGGFKLLDVANGTTGSDGVNLAQVQAIAAGVGVFQGGYNAATNSPAIAGASNTALTTGDFFVVTTDGTIAFNGSNVAVEVGDMIYANSNISASSDPAATAYSIVIQDANIAGTGSTDGNTEKGVAGFNSATFSATSNGWISVKAGGISDAQLASTFNKIIGIDTDIDTSGVEVVDRISLTDGVVETLTKRTLPTTSQTNLGVVEMADTLEVTAGTETDKAISPATLRASHQEESYSVAFPNAAATSFSVLASTHKLGTGPFIIQTYAKLGSQIFMDVNADPSTGEVELGWTTSVNANEFTLVMSRVR